MRIPSGVTDQYIYWVAVDSTDYVTRETGLSSFTIYRSRNGAAAAAMSSPTTAELSSGNLPGVYSLLLDEDMTIAAGNDSEEMVFHITKAGMAPVTRTIELYRPKITAGYTLGVNSSGHVSRATLCDTTTTNSDMRGTDSGATAANLATVDTVVDGIQTDLSNGTDGLGALKALIDTVDTVADAVKAKTDQLTFTVSNQVDSNALSAALTVAAIADGVWDEAQSGHTTSGTFGKYLDAQVSTVSAPTAAAVADAVWDEAISGHAVAGSTGATLSSAGSAGDPWTTAIPASYTAGQAGYVLGTTVVNGLTNDAIVYVNPSTQYDLELIRGDAYDGTSHAKLSFPAGQSIADVACTLTVRNADTDASLINIDGVGVGSNAVITLTSAQTASLVPGIQKFDVEVEHSGTSKQTVARGECIVLEDQTR